MESAQTGSVPSTKTVLIDALGILIFRRPSAALALHWQPYLLIGLLATWLAGIGRYWDSPRADLWQHLGLGSLAYVFVLAFILWLVVLPLKPQRWSYRNVLIFVSLTAPPALLYAIPVERFMPLPMAQSVNAWFLAAVASWRVALLIWFLRRIAMLQWLAVLVATLLPLTLIVVSLAIFNLEHVVFNIMAGNAPDQRSGNDLAYQVVILLALLSTALAPVVIAAYGWLVYRLRRNPSGIQQ